MQIYVCVKQVPDSAANITIVEGKSIDEGISILTGVEAGESDEKGNFPSSSVNGKVVARLKELSETVKSFNRSKHDKDQTKQK